MAVQSIDISLDGGHADLYLKGPAVPVRRVAVKPADGGEWRTEAPEYWGEITERIYDLGTVYAEENRATGDPGGTYRQPLYREISIEQDFHPTEEQDSIMRFNLLSNRQRVNVIRSGREDWSTWALPGASAETDGTLSASTLTNLTTGAARRFDLIGNTSTWTRARTAEEQLADFVAHAGAGGGAQAARYAAAIHRATQQNYEGWAGEIAGRVGKSGLVVAKMPPGLYGPSFDSVYHYNECLPLDTTNYKVTREPAITAERVPGPKLRTGAQQSERVEFWAVPQHHDLTIAWWTQYLWESFVTGGEFWIRQMRLWRNRLPVMPFPFGFSGSAMSVNNDRAISEQTRFSRNYQAMKAADLAVEVSLGLLVIRMAGRFEGEWLATRGDYRAGTLAGIYRVGSDEWHVWRTTDLIRPYEEIGRGALDIGGEVHGLTGLFEFGLPPSVRF